MTNTQASWIPIGLYVLLPLFSLRQVPVAGSILPVLTLILVLLFPGESFVLGNSLARSLETHSDLMDTALKPASLVGTSQNIRTPGYRPLVPSCGLPLSTASTVRRLCSRGKLIRVLWSSWLLSLSLVPGLRQFKRKRVLLPYCMVLGMELCSILCLPQPSGMYLVFWAWFETTTIQRNKQTKKKCNLGARYLELKGTGKDLFFQPLVIYLNTICILYEENTNYIFKCLI